MKGLLKVAFVSALFLCVWLDATATEEAWQTSLRDEITRTQQLGFGHSYNVSSSRIHVPVTPLMADIFWETPRAEVIAFLEFLAVDENYQKQRSYLSMCSRALAQDERSVPSKRKFADEHEEAVVYYHIAFTSLPKKDGREPNQPPQRNAGSRPSSDDSSASETPASLGPRG